MPFNGVRSSCDIVARNADFMSLACCNSDVLLLQRVLVALEFRDIPRGGKHTLQLPVAVIQCRGVVGNDYFGAVAGAGR